MRASAFKVAEKRLLDLANRQFGLLRESDLGLGRGAVRARRQTCRLTLIHPGVYAFGHTALRDEGHWLAALWTCDAHAALSHHTAAAFHGWRIADPDPRIHISATATRQSSDERIVVHRTRHLERVDVFRRAPLRVTHMPRTLVDLADVMAWPDYRALADGLPRLHVEEIRAAQQRAPRRPGASLVHRLIEADDTHTKSEFERRFLRFLKAHELPRPDHLNHAVAGHKADCVYDTGARLVVELDGRAYHDRRAQMRADRHRDTDYQLAGYLVLRLVWDDLHRAEAARTADRLRRMLTLRAP